MSIRKVIHFLRYAPIAVASAPQSFVVYLWYNNAIAKLADSLQLNLDPFWHNIFSLFAGGASEAIFIGIVFWGMAGVKTRWIPFTLAVALIFSVGVAINGEIKSKALEVVLHSGFPLMAFGFAQIMHAADIELSKNEKKEKDYAAANAERDDALKIKKQVEDLLHAAKAKLQSRELELIDARKHLEDANEQIGIMDAQIAELNNIASLAKDRTLRDIILTAWDSEVRKEKNITLREIASLLGMANHQNVAYHLKSAGRVVSDDDVQGDDSPRRVGKAKTRILPQ